MGARYGEAMGAPTGGPKERRYWGRGSNDTQAMVAKYGEAMGAPTGGPKERRYGGRGSNDTWAKGARYGRGHGSNDKDAPQPSTCPHLLFRLSLQVSRSIEGGS
eukprot:TRINITY_DN1295_c0_g1_i1.p5 TRINITY_DN1295_c0_g1~~TRINITY_DN1295_c0_g1_i1.p5  ORF type:complete len:104 (-),score=2.17 TRINITY_DN1295_c0_g1_i1:521-832(-)